MNWRPLAGVLVRVVWMSGARRWEDSVRPESKNEDRDHQSGADSELVWDECAEKRK